MDLAENYKEKQNQHKVFHLTIFFVLQRSFGNNQYGLLVIQKRLDLIVERKEKYLNFQFLFYYFFSLLSSLNLIYSMILYY